MDWIITAVGSTWGLGVWVLIGWAATGADIPRDSRWNLFDAEMPDRHPGQEPGRWSLPGVPPGWMEALLVSLRRGGKREDLYFGGDHGGVLENSPPDDC
jgi:hypothetical protein